ncbi:MAG: nucleotide exchange factor GrpE [Bacteroidetes bacterium CG2_30_33_31]|nr:MAG: nucleotide exchange factor GrpE [Bacteroidetes bacterium CG2_30_33_31]
MNEKEKDFVEKEDINQNTANNSETQNKNGYNEMSESEDDIKNLKGAAKRKALKAKKKEDELKGEIEKIKIQNAELNDKFLRLYSEFDNYRKRTIKEKSELYKTAAESTIIALLPIADDFERALKSIDESQSAAAHKEGMELIYNKFINSIISQGVEPISEKDVDFNTDFHEAITKIPAPTEALKNKVVDVIEKGYKLNGKVIRYAKVVIGE